MIFVQVLCKHLTCVVMICDDIYKHIMYTDVVFVATLHRASCKSTVCVAQSKHCM